MSAKYLAIPVIFYTFIEIEYGNTNHDEYHGE